MQKKKGEFQFVGEINETTPPLCVDFGREGVNIYSIHHNDKIILASFDTKKKKVINLHIVEIKKK